MIEKVVYQPTRKRLPKSRPSRTTSFSVGGAEGYMTSGSYPDDGLGEVFLKLGKQGSTLAGVMDAFSIATSIGLQYGVPLETYVQKFTNLKFEPAGLTDDPDIRMAQSIMDYIFRRLALDYLTFDERAELGIYTASERARQVETGSYLAEEVEEIESESLKNDAGDQVDTDSGASMSAMVTSRLRPVPGPPRSCSRRSPGPASTHRCASPAARRCGRAAAATSARAAAKRSGVVEPFNRDKAVSGVRKACKGRPVTEDQLARLGQLVEDSIRASGQPEIPADEVGVAILGPLRDLDQVAYLRFASVYRQYDSVDDFEAEIALLRAESEPLGIEPLVPDRVGDSRVSTFVPHKRSPGRASPP